MPIYEYHCQNCGEKTETLQKVSDQPLTKCPHCQKDTLQKQVSAPSFQLKGTGWYVTDFRDKNKPKASTPEVPKTEPKAEPTTSEPSKSTDKNTKKE